MISTGQILAAGVLTGIAVAVAAFASRWPAPALVAAAASSFGLIVAWRAISNLLGLNGDYVPAVSAGDTVCLVAGALGPALVGRLSGARNPWAPVVAGGVFGFLVNVIIL